MVMAKESDPVHIMWMHLTGTNGWAIKSNFPNLNSGRVFRLDWFDLFLNFVTLTLIVVALFTKVIHQVGRQKLHLSFLPRPVCPSCWS